MSFCELNTRTVERYMRFAHATMPAHMKRREMIVEFYGQMRGRGALIARLLHGPLQNHQSWIPVPGARR